MDKQRVIKKIKYEPVLQDHTCVEVFKFSDLNKRTSSKRMSMSYRYECCMFILITQGTCTHWIDFEEVSCSKGTMLKISPGQVHNFGKDKEWDGWIILCQSEQVAPQEKTIDRNLVHFELEPLTSRLSLTDKELARAVMAIKQLQADSLLVDKFDKLTRLLQSEIVTFVAWLNLIDVEKNRAVSYQSKNRVLFDNFRYLIEKYFDELIHVSDYAVLLHYSEKTLNRICKENMGITAKKMISNRRTLEGKRLLVHTSYTISNISMKLKFNEPSQFNIFFKRETGLTPTQFRKIQAITF